MFRRLGTAAEPFRAEIDLRRTLAGGLRASPLDGVKTLAQFLSEISQLVADKALDQKITARPKQTAGEAKRAPHKFDRSADIRIPDAAQPRRQIREDTVNTAGGYPLELVLGLQRKYVPLEQHDVFLPHGFDRLEIHSDDFPRASRKPSGDLKPATRRRAKIHHSVARAYEAEPPVELKQFIGGAGAKTFFSCLPIKGIFWLVRHKISIRQKPAGEQAGQF